MKNLSLPISMDDVLRGKSVEWDPASLSYAGASKDRVTVLPLSLREELMQQAERAREVWKQHGRSEKWIQQRMMGQETRAKLTDYWATHEVKEGQEYAILTNLIHQEWSGVSVRTHKDLKGLKTQNLRDHMSEAELIFTALAELSTRQIAERDEARGLQENQVAAKAGGAISRKARLELEARTGQKVVTGENSLPPAKNLGRKKP